MNLTLRQISLIRSNFRKLQPIAGTLAELFQARLCALSPRFGASFGPSPCGEQAVDWSERGREFMRQLRTLIIYLDRFDFLTPAISALARLRMARDMRPADYDLLGQAFIWTLARGLEDEFTDEAKLAWLDAFSLLASLLQQTLREKRAETGSRRGAMAAAA